jgi:homoserine kinase
MPTIRVPASTTNLGPGFDALGMALQLYNSVSVEWAETPLVAVAGEGARTIQRDSRNLAYRAAAAYLEAAGEPARPLRIELQNAIPVGRGLGSSAAAIVGGLLGAGALCGSPLPAQRVLQLAFEMEGHPDNVAPALLGGFQTACLVEEQVVSLRLPTPRGLGVVLAIPDMPLATERARAALPAFVPRRDAVFNVGRACLLLGALGEGRLDLLGVAMDDRLHQPYRSELLPGFPAALAAAREAGAAGACLSGAGSTLLAFVAGENPSVGAAMCAALAAHGVPARPLVVAIDEEGARQADG